MAKSTLFNTAYSRLAMAAVLFFCGISALRAADPVRWLESKYDFGAFSEEQGPVTAEFRFVNDSDEPVAIIQAAATCGCTVAEYSVDPIAPGDTAVVFVKYDPEGRPGRFSKQVFVRTSATMERHKLDISGIVIGSSSTIGGRYPVSIGPLKLRNGAVMMGRVPMGSGKSEFVDGYNQSADSIRPTFSHMPPYINIKSTPEVVAPGDLVSLNVYFRGERNKDYGILTDSVMVRACADCDSVWLPIVAIVEEDFSKLTDAQRANAPVLTIVGDKVDLGTVPADATKPVTAKIRIANMGKSPLIIRRVYSTDPAISVKAKSETMKPGKDTELTVTFDPTKHVGDIINTRFTIIANDPSQPTRSIRVVGLR